MNPDFASPLGQELLDDYYAECDELLTAIRRTLAALEHMPDRSEAGRAQFEELFRHFHSLKGISAIAGVSSAEQLAHTAEDLLRAVSKGATKLTGQSFDGLTEATAQIELIISAHQQGKPPPEPTKLMARLRAAAVAGVVPESAREVSAATPVVPPLNPAEAARSRNLEPWQCIFEPSAALSQRGVNISSVRERLLELGEIFDVSPSVRPNATMAFLITVGLKAPPADPEAWAADGIRFEPVKVNAVVPGEALSPADPIAALSLTPSHMVRVDLTRLDDLMRIAGEMVILRSRLEERINQMFNGHEALKEIDLGLARSLRELRKAITRVRLVPISEIFARIPFVIRDLSTGSGKRARVVLTGHETTIDKYLADRLNEPLLHLVRNAFSHGIEPAAERRTLGKPEEGTVSLHAERDGDFVVIKVRDDGRGMVVDRVTERAKLLGLPVPERLDMAGLLDLLCKPGFSTRENADRAAGRGIGMAVVANATRELGGTLSLQTSSAKGTEFSLRLPLTLSIMDAIIVSAGAETCALPQNCIEEIVQVPTHEIRTISHAEVVNYRGGLLPFRRFRAVFSLESAEAKLLTLVVLKSERGSAGLVVDRVHSRREIVVRPLSDPLVRVPEVSGASELGDGRPILVLDPNTICNGVVRPHAIETTPFSSVFSPPNAHEPR